MYDLCLQVVSFTSGFPTKTLNYDSFYAKISKMLVDPLIYQITRRHIPDDSNININRYQNVRLP